ncbi:SGNH/GDSL hydrolase family protein [soil metagenome]
MTDRGLWLFLGDSITQGVRHTHGRRIYPQLIEDRIRAELARYEQVFVNAAVNGSTVEDFVAGDSTPLWGLRPTVCSIMFGVNDSQAGADAATAYGEHLVGLVRRAAESGATVVLHVPTPVVGEQRTGPRASLPRYAQLARDVAAAEGAILVDHDAAFLGAAGPGATDLMDDDLHPNARGHELIASAMLEAMRRAPGSGWV